MKSLLDRLSLRQKFIWMIVPSLLLLVGLFGILVMRTYDAARFSQDEAAGVPAVRSLLEVVRHTQQHRGMSAAMLNGNTAMAPKRAAKEADVSAALARLKPEMATQPLDEAGRKEWADVQARWAAVQARMATPHPKAAEMVPMHTQLIGTQLALLDSVLDTSGLSLDPERATYNMIMAVGQHMPRMIESLGQLRALGSAALARKSLSPTERAALQAIVQIARLHRDNASQALQRTLSTAPGMQAAFGGNAERVLDPATQALALVQAKVLDAASLDMPSGEYFDAMTLVIDAAYASIDKVLPVLQAELDARAGSQRREVIALGVIVPLALLLTVWLSFAISRAVVGAAHRAVEVAEGMARGELDGRIEANGGDELADMLRALGRTQAALAGSVAGIRQGIEAVSNASNEIAQGNADLSARTEQQASSVEQTAATMEQMNGSVVATAGNAQRANDLASAVSIAAESGGAKVLQVVDTMTQIQGASRRIADIIGVIDGIAFQTNILALNAAVEAARAGEQGRGFAVVAGEVRSLASRSAEAAREIKQLIAESVDKVERGSTAVQDAGHTIEALVAQVQQVTSLVQEISDASQEQRTGIGEVNAAIGQLDDMTQRNAALVQQSAAASHSLREQADKLTAAVAIFRLDAHGAAMRA